MAPIIKDVPPDAGPRASAIAPIMAATPCREISRYLTTFPASDNLSSLLLYTVDTIDKIEDTINNAAPATFSPRARFPAFIIPKPIDPNPAMPTDADAIFRSSAIPFLDCDVKTILAIELAIAKARPTSAMTFHFVVPACMTSNVPKSDSTVKVITALPKFHLLFASTVGSAPTKAATTLSAVTIENTFVKAAPSARCLQRFDAASSLPW